MTAAAMPSRSPVLCTTFSDFDGQITTLIRKSPVWRAQDNLLRSVRGIGPVTPRRTNRT
jgi:hypothetical protein